MAWDAGREEELRRLFEEKVTQENLRKHCYATEAVMRRLAERLGQDAELWGWAGLLHDLDFEQTKDNPSRHGLESAAWLEACGAPPELIQAVKAHNAEALGLTRRTLLDYALTCAETITGLIVATALVQPDKKLAGVKASSVRKRMKETAFARNVNREHILLCRELGLDLEEFIALSLEAMQGIAGRLGL
ncbi:MAG: HDIG domain-containing protein [Clostridia bacterium]|nr:HDIG domain-containing protein [Clostridia bacterium]MDH7573172.1 HDIG domain-containing protein [Clostridia bacterium]